MKQINCYLIEVDQFEKQHRRTATKSAYLDFLLKNSR
jgi:hypothetical protein